MEIVTQVSQFILSLSILIVLHEMGHFIPAKLFKTKVEKFYLFFDPWFSLFKFKKGETEYGIGWLPLGGYVKISGMIDESMDKEQMKLPPQPWEFRSKPAWQRLIIMVGGVTVNVILGILIYAMVLFVWNEEYLPSKNLTYGIATDSLGSAIGLRDGDKILGVNNVPEPNFNKIPAQILLNETRSIQVERNGQQIDVPVTEEHISQMISESRARNMIVAPRFPCIVDSLETGLPAQKSGIQKGDQILAVNGQPASFHNEVTSILRKNPSKTVEILLQRNNDSVVVKTPVSAEGTIGFYPKSPASFFKMDTIQYGFFESFPAGIRKASETFSDYVKQMKVLFTVPGAHKQIGGFLTIGKAYSTSWDWERFWTFTAFLSIVLAIMNILPIPALDGGHVMFLLYEVITRRKPNEKLMEYAQYAGMLLLLALLLYANGNDVVRLFKN
jgi:regulator of sigma E protease